MATEEMRALARAYFEGSISPADERRLCDFILTDERHMAQIREWEDAWSATYHFDADTEAGWHRLSDRIAELRAERRRRMAVRRWVASAAAVAALMALTATATWYLFGPRPEQYYALTAPLGSRSQLTLPDGTQVWLNAGSTLRYSDRFGRGSRHVELQGEGYFEVARDEEREFRVATRAYDVVVHGTHFDVSAYRDDRYVTTSLVEGSVSVEREGGSVMMVPGDMVSLDTRTGAVSRTRFSSDTHAWMHGVLDYDDIALADLARIISRQYAVTIHVEGGRARATRLSISLRNKETIEDVLDALRRVAPLRIEQQGREIRIR